MNEKVKAFLDEKKAIEKKKYEKKKEETLIDLGLYEKIYSENNEYSDAFPYSEYDVETSKNRQYRIEPFAISDEEYEEVKKYVKQGGINRFITVDKALTIIAWSIFIGGFIAGLALGNVEVVKMGLYDTSYTETQFSFATAFAYWCGALISGTMFLGFAEIIKLLEAIKRK